MPQLKEKEWRLALNCGKLRAKFWLRDVETESSLQGLCFSAGMHI